MPESEIYVCDADSLINLHRHFGRQATSVLRRLSQTRKLRLPEGVVRELKRGTDKLAKFVQKHRQYIEVTARQIPSLHTEIPRLEGLYGEKIRLGTQEYLGFWHSKAGRKAVDAQVVAVAKVLEGVAVSDDQAVKLVCALESVPCISWSEFARRLGLIKPQQLNLNLGGAGGGV